MGFIVTYWSRPAQNPLMYHINVSQLQVWLYKGNFPGFLTILTLSVTLEIRSIRTLLIARE